MLPLYVFAAGTLRSLPGRALAGAAGPIAIALWAAVPLAGDLAGSGDARSSAGASSPGREHRSLLQSAAGRSPPPPIAVHLASSRRGLLLGVWLTALLAGQAALPALAGAAPESAGRSVVAIWAVGILLALGVRAPDDDAGREAGTGGGVRLGILRSIESRLERVVEGSVGRLFRASVAPVELARKLAKKLEEGKVVSVTQTYAPNEYTIYLSPRDRTRFADFEASLRNELASYLAEHARRAGYVIANAPEVRFETESSLHTGIFGISTALVRDDESLLARCAAAPPAAAAPVGVPWTPPPGTPTVPVVPVRARSAGGRTRAPADALAESTGAGALAARPRLRRARLPAWRRSRSIRSRWPRSSPAVPIAAAAGPPLPRQSRRPTSRTSRRSRARRGAAHAVRPATRRDDGRAARAARGALCSCTTISAP